jgi:hypothetical protein
MRPIFLKITEIRRDLPGLISEKPALFIRKISTVHQKKSVLFIKKSVQKSDSVTFDSFHSIKFLNTGLEHTVESGSVSSSCAE